MLVQVLLAKEYQFREDQVAILAEALEQPWLDAGDVLGEAGQSGQKAGTVRPGQASPQHRGPYPRGWALL